MNVKKIAGVCLCAVAIVGCASLEERLASTDSTVRKEAEQELVSRQDYVFDAKARMDAVKRVQDEEVLCNFAMTIDDPLSERYQDRRPEAMVAVEKITKDEFLAKIAVNGASSKIRAAAFEKIKKTEVKEQTAKLMEARVKMEQEKLLKLIRRAKKEGDRRRLKKLVMMLDFRRPEVALEILSKHKYLLIDSEYESLGLKEKVFSALKENDLVLLLNGELDRILKEEVAKRLLAVTKDTNILVKMFDGDLKDRVGYDGQKTAAKKLVANAASISDKKVIAKLLDSEYVKSEEDRKVLLLRFSEDEAVQYVMENIDRQSVYSWNNEHLTAFNDGVVVTSIIKKPESVVRIVSAILAKIVSYRKECKDSWTMSWDSKDDKKASNLIKGFPKFSDATIGELICADETSWKYLMDGVSGTVAYDVLSKGKAKSAELELSLVKKLPKEKIDMAVYNGVKYDGTKKAVRDAMSPELKKQVAESEEKAYVAIVEKAKNAAKETFVLDGFYLGMAFDDVKVVFSHHFPDWQIEESNDGKGENADWVIYVPGQESPFCYADAKDKKVYQFNFGKKVLKKWYKYDVQNYAEWASAYNREHKINMQYKMVEKETTVYEPMDMSRSYRVWFYQHSYQYKHNAKEYRLTYFGDEKDFTGHGGIGGEIIKAAAAYNLRYVRGDPGSLRAKIERD